MTTQTREFAFDVNMKASIRIQATSKEEALATMRDTLDSMSCEARDTRWPDGSVIRFEASMNDDNPLLTKGAGMEVQAPTALRVMIPAGKYFLGDPCYAVPDRLWNRLLASSKFFAYPVGTVHGHEVLGFNTRYGDGKYKDQYGNEYPVDSGLIGLVPEALLDPEEFARHHPLCPGIWVKFNYPTLCESDAGVLRFGKHIIDTIQEDA